jgi:hypothetical protein
LEKAQGVTMRRNNLIHAQWSFEGKHLKAQTYKPNASKPRSEFVVTAKSVEQLAVDYRTAGTLIDAWVLDKVNADHMAADTAPAPSSGEPSS